jgi:pimeloyl-ACP methyl ester carboxylesterase
VPSVGTIILQVRVAFGSGGVSTRFRGCARAHVPLIERPKAMQVPSILQGESLTRLLQGMAIGAVTSMVIGFSWGGWVTGGTAVKLADERANTAVVAALTPICVEKFLQNSDAKANLAVLQKVSSNWEQGDYLEKGGWATPPGATSPDYHLARACAEKLAQAKTASQ